MANKKVFDLDEFIEDETIKLKKLLFDAIDDLEEDKKVAGVKSATSSSKELEDDDDFPF